MNKVSTAVSSCSRSFAQPHAAAAVPPVLVISVDGLHPAYVTEADRHGLKVPALRRLMQQGAHARGVVGVVPTVTYPSHTTLMTGVTPQEHGIISNTPFDPLNVNKEGWYWYAEDIKAKTLWEVAAKRWPAHGQRELAGHRRRSKHLFSAAGVLARFDRRRSQAHASARPTRKT